MTDTATVSTSAPEAPAFSANDLTSSVPAEATLGDLVGRVNALSAALVGVQSALASAKGGELTAEQLSAVNKITAFFSV